MPPVPHIPTAEAQDHAGLIAALDADDLAGAERHRAETLAATCAGCTALAADLVAIRQALVALPVPPRRRDYRLTDEDAVRLRPSGWRRLVGWLAAPRSSVRPLATGLATLGVVGLLLTAGLPGLGARDMTVLSAAGSPAEAPLAVPNQDAEYQATGAPGVHPSAAPAGGESVAGEGPSAAPTVNRNSPPGSPDDTSGIKSGDAPGPPDPGIPLSLALSVALLAGGIGLLLARAIALRRA